MQIQRFRDIGLCADMQAFRRALEGFAAQMDFEKYVASMVYGEDRAGADVRFLSVSNCPDAFATSTDVANCRRDPVNAALRTTSVPFMYDRRLYVASGADDLWEEQARFGYRTGIAVALHLPGNKHFLLGLDRERDLPSGSEQLSRLLADLQMLAVHAQLAADMLLGDKPTPLPEVHLTRQERAILQLSMEGRTSDEIAERLGLSAAEVQRHTRLALVKLNSNSKHEAVVRALGSGLL